MGVVSRLESAHGKTPLLLFPCFHRTHGRQAAHAKHAIVFYAFDVLHLNGEDLTGRLLEKRRSHLPAIVKAQGF